MIKYVGITVETYEKFIICMKHKVRKIEEREPIYITLYDYNLICINM